MGEDRYRPIHTAAAYSDDPRVVQTLVDAGAKPQQMLGRKFFYGDDMVQSYRAALTPLHLAAAYNDNPAITRALIEAGADPNRKGGVYASPLHQAAKWGNAEVVRALIDAGADIERSGPKHWMDSKKPLHLAAERNSPQVVQALIDAGANLEAQDKNGLTPLQYATAENGNPAVREALLAAGAGKTERSRASASARQQSRQGGGRGLGALIAGMTAATVGAASGLDTAEALEVGTEAAEAVLTGQPPAERPSGGLDPNVFAPARTSGGTSHSGTCLIPNFPNHDPAAPFKIPWCTSGGPQVETFAQYAATLECVMSQLEDPNQIQEMRGVIARTCSNLEAMQHLGGNWHCKCPPGFGGPGYSEDSGAIEQEKRRIEQQARQQEEAARAARRDREARRAEEARQAALREKRRIEATKVDVLNSDCSCIRVRDNGEYVCMDGFVGGRCDIWRDR